MPLQTPPVNPHESSVGLHKCCSQTITNSCEPSRIVCGYTNVFCRPLEIPPVCFPDPLCIIANVICGPLRTPPVNTPEMSMGHHKCCLQTIANSSCKLSRILCGSSQMFFAAIANPHMTFTECQRKPPQNIYRSPTGP